MIGRFSGLNGGLGLPDGLIEPPELGEHVGEAGSRDRRVDDCGPKALIAQVALEGGVPFEEGGRLAELALGEVRLAKSGRSEHLDRAITEGARDGEGLLPEPGGRVVVAREHALIGHGAGYPPEPLLVAERPGEPLRLAEMLAHSLPLAEPEERVSEVQM